MRAALNRLLDAKLQPFLVFSPETITDQKQLLTIKDMLIPEATKLSFAAPETLDIKKIIQANQELKALTPRIRAASIATINNGIQKADDTKLLRELLTLIEH